MQREIKKYLLSAKSVLENLLPYEPKETNTILFESFGFNDEKLFSEFLMNDFFDKFSHWGKLNSS